MTTKLLAVDDSKTMRQVIEHTFAGEPYDAIAVEGATQALAAVAMDTFRIALVDVSLSDGDGYEVCRAIRERSPGTSVILLSSKHHPYDEARGLGAGASGNIDKPFDTQTMIDRVAALSDVAAAPVPPLSVAPVRRDDDLDTELVEVDAEELEVSGHDGGGLDFEEASMTELEIVPDDSAELVPPSAPRVLRASAPPKPVLAASVSNAGMAQKLSQMGLTAAQAEAVLSLTREVVEQAVWEVVPQLAEVLIKEEIRRLTSEQ